MLNRRFFIPMASAVIAYPLHVVAAQSYSFAALQWGDSFSRVKDKLKIAGYSEPKPVEFLSEMAKERKQSGARFIGQIDGVDFNGFLNFAADRLISVSLDFILDIRTYSTQSGNLLGLLKLRYGKGRRGGVAQSNVKYNMVWGRFPNETLEYLLFIFTPGPNLPVRVEIKYNSPEANRLIAQAKVQQDAKARMEREEETAKRAKESLKF